jgi:PEP-CTERM motif
MKNSALVLLLAVLLFVFVTPAVADIVYTNLGSGSTYIGTSGDGVAGSGTGVGSQSFADPFAVPAGPGYNLTQLDVAVSWNGLGTNSAIIELLTNSGGLPGSTVLGSWTLTNLPAFGTVGSIQPSQTISGISGIPLSGGTQYWLAAFAGASSTFDSWNSNSTGATGTNAFSTNGGTTWIPNGPGARLDAFDVLGTPIATPEPGTLTLLGCGLIGLAVAFRRKSALATAN